MSNSPEFYEQLFSLFSSAKKNTKQTKSLDRVRITLSYKKDARNMLIKLTLDK